jgi:hypothetical protein
MSRLLSAGVSHLGLGGVKEWIVVLPAVFLQPLHLQWNSQ